MMEGAPLGDAKLQRAAPALSLVQGSVATSDIGPPSQLEEILQHNELIKNLDVHTMHGQQEQDASSA